MFVETDLMFPKESRRRAEDILEEAKATYNVQIFSGATHGFGTRGDPNLEDSRMLNLLIIIMSLISILFDTRLGKGEIGARN